MIEFRTAPTRPDRSRASDPWSHVETAYRRAVEQGEEVVLLAVEFLDLAHLAATCAVEPDTLFATVETVLRDLPGARGVSVARRQEHLVALLPGRSLQEGEVLAAALVSACDSLEIDGQKRRAVPVLGLARLPDKGEIHLETLVRVAEEGARVAGFRGPGCTVHTMLYTSVGERVRREIAVDGAAFTPPPVRGAASRGARRTTAAEAPQAHAAEELAPALEARIREIATRELAGSRGPEAANRRPAAPAGTEDRRDALCGAVTERVLATLRSEAVHTLEPAPLAANVDRSNGPGETGEVQLLRRRVTKLVDALARSEQRLASVERTGGVSGIASAFRTVQGLTGNECHADRKRTLLRQVLEANLALRDGIQARAQRAAPGPTPT